MINWLYDYIRVRAGSDLKTKSPAGSSGAFSFSGGNSGGNVEQGSAGGVIGGVLGAADTLDRGPKIGFL